MEELDTAGLLDTRAVPRRPLRGSAPRGAGIGTTPCGSGFKVEIVPIVERTLAWLPRFRRVVTRYDRNSNHEDGLVYGACAFIAINKRLGNRC